MRNDGDWSTRKTTWQVMLIDANDANNANNAHDGN